MFNDQFILLREMTTSEFIELMLCTGVMLRIAPHFITLQPFFFIRCAHVVGTELRAASRSLSTTAMEVVAKKVRKTKHVLSFSGKSWLG